jgi:hypothetical protein
MSPRWRAQLVGALRVHPHKHDANFPPTKSSRICERRVDVKDLLVLYPFQAIRVLTPSAFWKWESEAEDG